MNTINNQENPKITIVPYKWGLLIASLNTQQHAWCRCAVRATREMDASRQARVRTKTVCQNLHLVFCNLYVLVATVATVATVVVHSCRTATHCNPTYFGRKFCRTIPSLNLEREALPK